MGVLFKDLIDVGFIVIVEEGGIHHDPVVGA
jgi:hypothetical protein